MKLNICLLPILLIALSLDSCSKKAEDIELAAEYLTAPPVETEIINPPVETTNPADYFRVPGSFTGEFPVYKYTMPEGRNRDWEHDIVYFYSIIQKNNLVFKNSQAETLELQRQIDSLIAKIPELEDYEIAYGLAEITAWIGDSHTEITYSSIDDVIFSVRV